MPVKLLGKQHMLFLGQNGFILMGKCAYSMKMPGQLESAQLIHITIDMMNMRGEVAFNLQNYS